jgi:DNA-binding NtrC family response regulator
MGRFWEFLANIPLTKKRINVLLVDDDEKLLKSLAARIRLKGYEPLAASRAIEAIEIAKRHKIHVAVVDQKMPDMDGLVTITKLKEIHPDVRKVLTSLEDTMAAAGMATGGDLEDAVKMDADSRKERSDED